MSNQYRKKQDERTWKRRNTSKPSVPNHHDPFLPTTPELRKPCGCLKTHTCSFDFASPDELSVEH
jgi:hypothetical protein